MIAYAFVLPCFRRRVHDIRAQIGTVVFYSFISAGATNTAQRCSLGALNNTLTVSMRGMLLSASAVDSVFRNSFQR